jgi:hypothetical protein
VDESGALAKGRLLYPVVMLVTILVSGNHLLLDAACSLVVVAVATGAAVLARR